MKAYIYIAITFITVTITSCKKESLQSYLVNSQEKTEFSHISIPSSILKLGGNAISKEDAATYNSIQKINITGLLVKNAAEGQYESEKLKLKNIFKNSDYKTLMNFKTNGYNTTLYYSGSTDAIDEIIAFGYAENLGVGIARVLGDKMDPNAIAKILDNTELDTDNLNLGQLTTAFGNLFK